MAKWQEFRGGSVYRRWDTANEWLYTALERDKEIEIKGIYTFPKNEFGEARLIIEFESEIVPSKTQDVYIS